MVESWSQLGLQAAGVNALLRLNGLRGRHELQLRNSFVARVDGGPLPPAVELLRIAGKEGVILRMLLVVAWLGKGAGARIGSVVVRAPIEDLADALGLVGSPENRRRRVRAAARSLQTLGYIDASEQVRGAFDLALCRDSPETNGGEFLPPGLASSSAPSREDAYLTMPYAFLRHGWATAMSGRAAVLVLALRYLEQTLKQPGRLFMSESMRIKRFGFSEEVYYAGAKELRSYGAVQTDRAGLRSDSNSHRARTTYRLQTNVWQWHPAQIPESSDLS
jgi:hypothetical protein